MVIASVSAIVLYVLSPFLFMVFAATVVVGVGLVFLVRRDRREAARR